MLVNILIGVISVVVLLAIFVAIRPSAFQVSRSENISAPPAAIFPHVNDLHQWEAWSPWEKVDPQIKKTFEGPNSGVGAIYRWDGNNQVGAGSNTIVESRPDELIRLRLDMLRPFVGSNDVEFTFQPKGDQTIVTWTMIGSLNFVTKIMDMLIGMDNMIGGQFKSGLTSLKQVVEANHVVKSTSSENG